MNARYFLDTNVLIHAFGRQEPRKAEIASDLVREGLGQRRAVISYQVVQEFFSVAFRFPGPPTTDEAQSYLTSVLRPLLSVHSSIDLYSEALYLRERYRLSWYDSVIVAAALEARCNVLYTEDLQHGQRFGDLVVTNPFQG